MSKVIIVTGVRSNIGTSIARSLSDAGHTVYGTTSKNVSIHPDSEEKIKLCQLDMSDKLAIEAFVEEVYKKEGKIDSLINNAAIGLTGPMEEMDLEDIEKIFQTNVFNLIRVSKVVIHYMRKQKYGNIINLSSIGGQIGLPFRSIFSATKFAIEGISEALSMELKQFNINVSVLEPGSFKSNSNTNRKVALVSVYSKYKTNFDNTLNRIENDRKESETDIELGNTILKIIDSKNPQFRYKIGPLKQKLYPIIKSLIPFRWYEKIIMKHYGISANPNINDVPDVLKSEEELENSSNSNSKSIFKK